MTVEYIHLDVHTVGEPLHVDLRILDWCTMDENDSLLYDSNRTNKIQTLDLLNSNTSNDSNFNRFSN